MEFYQTYVPNFERKGTLSLRADHSEYDLTKTRVSNWQQDAESYPKDYDCKTDPVWNLKRATYKHLSNHDVPNGVWDDGLTFPKTTTQELYDDLTKKGTYVNKSNSDAQYTGSHATDSRLDSLGPQIVGKLPPGADVFLDKTTYRDDYKYKGEEFVPKTKSAEELLQEAQAMREKDILVTSANKGNLSQFTEKYTNKRVGRNTWQDETGVYATALHKRLNTTQFNPILNSYVS